MDELVGQLYNLRKSNPALLGDIENARIFELIENGKLDFQFFKKIKLTTNIHRISKNVIEDCRKLADNENGIKTYLQDTNHTKILSETANGEVAEVGSKLFLNDNGNLVEINLSKEKYLELFPPLERFNINQNESKYAGNCWLLETAFNLYNSPSTRNQILKLFRQEGNDVYVKLPNINLELKFNNGDLPQDNTSEYFLSNSPKWMNMIEYATAFSRNNDSLEKNILNNIEGYKKIGLVKEAENGALAFDINTYLKDRDTSMLYNLYGGNAKEATILLTDNKKNIEYNMHAITDKKARKKIKKEIKEMLYSLQNKSGYSINTAIYSHAFAVSRIENGKIYLINPYNANLEIEFKIDDFVENYCNHLEISDFT